MLNSGWLPIVKRAMPSVETLRWALWDAETPGTINKMGHAMAVCTYLGAGLDMPNLRSLTLDCSHHNLFSTPEGMLVLYRTLHGVSMRLRHLELYHLYFLPPDLFWPSEPKGSNACTNAISEEPFWPHLETIEISVRYSDLFHSSYPNDEPFFEFEQTPYDTDEYDCPREPEYAWRLAAEPVEFNKVATAISRAMLNMPKLQTFTFNGVLDGHQEYISDKLQCERQEARWEAARHLPPPRRTHAEMKAERARKRAMRKHALERAFLFMPGYRAERPEYVEWLEGVAAGEYDDSDSDEDLMLGVKSTKEDEESEVGSEEYVGAIDEHLPFYYKRAITALGPEASDAVYGPMAGFAKVVGWKPPKEVLRNWATLRRRLMRKERETGKVVG